MKTERRLRFSRLLIFVLALFVSATLEAHPPAANPLPLKGKLTVSGAATLSPLISDIAKRFEKLNPGAKVEVKAVGSGAGLADLRAGTADIAMLSRALLNTERDLFAFPIARDGVAFIVHRDNPVRNVDTRELTALLTGQLVNWKTLGGRDAPVNLAWRNGHGSVQFILDRLNLKREQIAAHTVTTGVVDEIQVIGDDRNAITLASVAHAERGVQAGVPIRLLAYNGIAASSRTIESHNYMLSRPLTRVTRRVPNGLQSQFIEYALSAHVVDLQLKHGFVPYQK